jgi:pyruvate/2-oxoglutarate dehydrogenase complex dihydrolipoamide acyltransferase (E2) component
VPRVNNNDDSVRIVSLGVVEGDFVKRGQIVGAVETDKAVLDVPSESDGYVLKILHRTGETAVVGSVLLWLGSAASEVAPEQASDPAAVSASGASRPTAKALAMLRELGLEPGAIPAAGDRLTVADIENWLAKNAPSDATTRGAIGGERRPAVPGQFKDLSSEERAMLATVTWHRDSAVSGYVEVEYDPKPWSDYAARYQSDNGLLMSPLLALMSYRLVEIARESPGINATIVGGRRYQYQSINLGFTVQAGATLYLAVVQNAHDMRAASFIDALGEVQRHAIAHKLSAAESSSATLSFSSMARWEVSRHVPILPRYTSLIVAHVAPRSEGKAVLGASYDHRLLSGFDAVSVLRRLAQPSA